MNTYLFEWIILEISNMKSKMYSIPRPLVCINAVIKLILGTHRRQLKPCFTCISSQFGRKIVTVNFSLTI